ncbi:hypothetical protein Poli38472_011715 [Pythium oligandrum]|uniref:GST C-terminal domain-containing protein n=1 Tax=Pythium oligandrum TaxID=41045 RepID=A0A8K1FFY0_PYTOL|nr:hypothetical protein Poli38472_011715 [Pythium oligandrum]|eukprot:TMW58127.1 hypothetical protein Poli38472_011715 [Pythium oligandrum]
MTSLANFIQNKPDAEFPAEKGRYHLYVALPCPYACRAIMAINLKGLQDFIDVTVTHPTMLRTRPDDENDTHKGWAFFDPKTTPFATGPNGEQLSTEGCTPDPIHGAKYVRDLYERVTKDPKVRFSVPLLWDKKKDTIVSTESADMVRMFNEAFEDLNPSNIDLYPADKRKEIDELNDWLNDSVFSVIFKAAFAPNDEAREAAIKDLYAGLDRVEDILSKKRYIAGNTFTETDIRLFVVLIRFDFSFAKFFKFPKLIEEYPNTLNYLRDVYQLPGIKETVDWEHLKLNAVGSQFNRDNVVLENPTVDYSAPHDRARFQ